MSILADTAIVLDDKRRELLKSSGGLNGASDGAGDACFGGSISIVATIDQFSYSSIPPKVTSYFNQWVDFIATVGNGDSTMMADENDETPCSEWEITLKDTSSVEVEGDETRFGFKVLSGERCPGIVWKV